MTTMGELLDTGTILLASDDGIFYQRSFGYSKYEDNIPNINDSIYNIGSISKSFTATAIMRLIQEEKLQLHDTLDMFFPALGAEAGQITIHHLLSMSSGIHQDIARSKTYDIDEVIFPEYVYQVPEDGSPFYSVRLVYEKKEVGLYLNLTSQSKVEGMHIDQTFSYNNPQSVESIIFDENTIFIDGFKYGYSDAFIIKEDEQWVFKTNLGELVIEPE